MDQRIRLGIKVMGLSFFVAGFLIPTCGISGLLLYSVLDPVMAADELASMAMFFFPFVVFGFPCVVVAARLTLLRRKGGLQIALYSTALLLGTLGFAGFWVGAMGI